MVEWEREWAYEGGTSGAAVYNAGPMLENDSEAVTEEDSRMLRSCADWGFGRFLRTIPGRWTAVS